MSSNVLNEWTLRVTRGGEAPLPQPSAEELALTGITLGGFAGPFLALLVGATHSAFLPTWIGISALAGFACYRAAGHEAAVLLQPEAAKRLIGSWLARYDWSTLEQAKARVNAVFAKADRDLDVVFTSWRGEFVKLMGDRRASVTDKLCTLMLVAALTSVAAGSFTRDGSAIAATAEPAQIDTMKLTLGARNLPVVGIDGI